MEIRETGDIKRRAGEVLLNQYTVQQNLQWHYCAALTSATAVLETRKLVSGFVCSFLMKS